MPKLPRVSYLLTWFLSTHEGTMQQSPKEDRPIDIIAQQFGRRRALKLLETLGGQGLYIPKNSTDNRLLTEIDEDIRSFLSERFGGEYVGFPVRFYSPAMTHKRIRDCITVGMKQNDIAQAVGCSTRTVRRQASKMRNDGLLPPLSGRTRIPHFSAQEASLP